MTKLGLVEVASADALLAVDVAATELLVDPAGDEPPDEPPDDPPDEPPQTVRR